MGGNAEFSASGDFKIVQPQIIACVEACVSGFRLNNYDKMVQICNVKLNTTVLVPSYDRSVDEVMSFNFQNEECRAELEYSAVPRSSLHKLLT